MVIFEKQNVRIVKTAAALSRSGFLIYKRSKTRVA